MVYRGSRSGRYRAMGHLVRRAGRRGLSRLQLGGAAIAAAAARYAHTYRSSSSAASPRRRFGAAPRQVAGTGSLARMSLKRKRKTRKKGKKKKRKALTAHAVTKMISNMFAQPQTRVQTWTEVIRNTLGHGVLHASAVAPVRNKDQYAGVYTLAQNLLGVVDGSGYLPSAIKKVQYSVSRKYTLVNQSNNTQFYKVWVYTPKVRRTWYSDDQYTDWTATLNSWSANNFVETAEQTAAALLDGNKTPVVYGGADPKVTPGHNKAWAQDHKLFSQKQFSLVSGASMVFHVKAHGVFNPMSWNAARASAAAIAGASAPLDAMYDEIPHVTKLVYIRQVGSMVTNDAAVASSAGPPVRAAIAKHGALTTAAGASSVQIFETWKTQFIARIPTEYTNVQQPVDDFTGANPVAFGISSLQPETSVALDGV